MKKPIALLTSAILAEACLVSCESREYKQSNPDVLTSRQIEILEENSLPTDMDKLNARQSGGIKAIESAFVYLEEKYPGVEFEYISHTQAGLMNTEYTTFVPVGLDKEDDRNIVTVNYDREGNYSDDYMLVAVREETEKVIQKYLESYFGKGNVKAYIKMNWTDLQYGDRINEETVIQKTNASTYFFVPEDTCSNEKMDMFCENCKNWNKKNNIDFHFRAILISRDDYDLTTYANHSELYDDNHIIYEVKVK